jgi:hypothetical protein
MKRLVQPIMLAAYRSCIVVASRAFCSVRVKSTKEAHNARPASLDVGWHAAAVAAHACLGRSAAKAVVFNRICAHTTPRSRRAGAARDNGDNRLPVLRYLSVVQTTYDQLVPFVKSEVMVNAALGLSHTDWCATKRVTSPRAGRAPVYLRGDVDWHMVKAIWRQDQIVVAKVAVETPCARDMLCQAISNADLGDLQRGTCR